MQWCLESSLWEMTTFRWGKEGYGPHDRINALIERGRNTGALSFHHVRIQGNCGPLQARELSPGVESSGPLILDCKKFVFRPQSLWYFVIAKPELRVEEGSSDLGQGGPLELRASFGLSWVSRVTTFTVAGAMNASVPKEEPGWDT